MISIDAGTGYQIQPIINSGDRKKTVELAVFNFFASLRCVTTSIIAFDQKILHKNRLKQTFGNVEIEEIHVEHCLYDTGHYGDDIKTILIVEPIYPV